MIQEVLVENNDVSKDGGIGKATIDYVGFLSVRMYDIDARPLQGDYTSNITA